MNRTFAVVLALAACGSTAKPVDHPAPVACPEPAPPPTAPQPVLPPTLDEAKLVANTDALLDAMDRADAPAFRSLVGPTFASIVTARTYDVEYIAKQLQARKDRSAPPRTHRWLSTRAKLAPNVAILVGETITDVPAESSHPAATVDRWNTVVWTFDGAAWKVASWEARAGGQAADRESWNITFAEGTNFNHEPNRLLVETIDKRKPGTALDIDSGQGRNALALAAKGWKVTAVDISDEGLRQAREQAATRKLRLETVQADFNKWDVGTAKWDLVTIIYAGTQDDNMAKIQRGVKKGGLVVVEFFQKDATRGTGIGGFEPGALAGAFKDGWTILRDEAVEDIADWGLAKTKLVRFVAQKK
jgi:SAM-dependent methyltransferase